MFGRGGASVGGLEGGRASGEKRGHLQSLYKGWVMGNGIYPI
ncbi:hypothetical protein [Chryseobacterium joostei]|nr:hypothetical protein [Chryseobacterium joostei]